MKSIKTALILVFLLSFFHIANAQEKYSSVKIYPPAGKIQRANLIGLLQIDHFQELEDGAIVSEISAGDVEKLRTTPYRYEVLVDDVARNLKEVNRRYYTDRARGILPEQNRLAFEQTGKTINSIIPAPAAFEVKETFGGYYQFFEMEDAMDDLVATYGTGPGAIVQKFSLSIKSHGNRDIWCIKISDNVASDEADEPEVLFIGLQHAREAIGGSSMIFFMQYLCENYATDQRIKDLVDNREIYIIPCMNPDGWVHNYNLDNDGGAGWRKNRRNNGSSYGVDLNRNWGVDWGNCSAPIQGDPTSCGSGSPSADTYYGPSAFSEPETRAIRDFTYTRQFVAMIDQHSYGPYYSLPFGRPSLSSNVMAPLDAKFYTHVSAAMGNYNGMRAGNSYEALGYEVAGGVKDWMLKGNIGIGTKGKIYGMTGEGGAGGGTGGSYGSFWPPAAEIINLCKGMVFQNLQLLYAAGSYINLQDQGDINLSSKTGTFDFNAIRVGLGDQPVHVSVIPLENIQSVGSTLSFSLANYADTYSSAINYTLPASLINGQRIRFAWKIETGGITYYDTITKFYNAQQLLYDNMEGSYATNWTNSSTSGAWGFTTNGTGYGGGSSKAMSESPSGNYGAGSTRINIYKNALNLSNATAAYLSFWVRHRAENFRDKLQVQVSANSTDGLNGSWTAIAGTTTVQEPGTLDGSSINGIPALTGIKEDWTRELFDLSAYLGASALRLRFVFTSGSSNSFAFSEDDGFYIDELKLIQTAVPLITLPVHFISFTGRLLSDETIRLDWNAVADQEHDYFEVERSANGKNFTSVGKGPSSAPYWKTDASPYTGNNFYRIKQVDKNGAITYSYTVNVYYNPKKIMAFVYPNPVSGTLNIKINSDRTQQYTISIADLTGRKVHEEKVISGSTGKEININFKQQAAQMYILTIRNNKNEIVAAQKIAIQ